jgi:hypothetical protein
VSTSVSVWVLVFAALAAANFPFLSHKFLGVFQPRGEKSLQIRFAELAMMYFAMGGLGMLLEQRAGQIAPQSWEFYAITLTLFITFAFPGFVYRYLLKHKE